ncbi:hypothetical protein ANN_08830 [Periplaneta americana]|uniref:Uncharacterized protein n=1 Tax=Periplaneta americana TaxID=6978 RepID=A0ABQ8T2K1_PERAM|nr:hypothetical protein ANN_08830 [Periplaneta americana]
MRPVLRYGTSSDDYDDDDDDDDDDDNEEGKRMRKKKNIDNDCSTLKKKSPGRNSIALRLSEATVRSRALRLLSLGPFEGTVRVSVMDSKVASRLGAVVATVMVFVHTERAALHAGSKEFQALQTLWLDPSLEVGDAGAVLFVNIKYGSFKGNIEGGEFDPVPWIEFGVAQWSERLVRRTKDPSSIPGD